MKGTRRSPVEPPVDMNTDFRVWLGIVRTIHDFNDVSVSGRIKLPFSMFLKTVDLTQHDRIST